MSTSSLLPASVQLSSPWSATRFRRAASGSSGWCLLGVPAQFLESACARLFLMGCKLLSEPFFSPSGRSVALHFSAPAHVAAKLALLLPCPAGVEPLAISASGTCVLSGAAARAKSARRQLVAGGPAQRVLL